MYVVVFFSMLLTKLCTADELLKTTAMTINGSAKATD